MKWLATLLATLAVLLTWTAASNTHAHEFRPAALALSERAPGRFAMRWTAPATTQDSTLDLFPEFPDHCELDGAVLDCGARGLVGEVRFPELGGTLYRVAVRVEWLGGVTTLRMIDGREPSFALYGVPSQAGAGALAELARAYSLLGVEHILTGIDHLLFVLGLVLLVRFTRALVVTITAFTVAHSITLAAAALEIAALPAAPVEAAIALSILLVAVECAKPRATLTRRAPWLVAFAFGLLHGFGFAGALAEVGLPPHQTPLALLFFNVGVELGQLGMIGLAWAVSWAVRARLSRPEWVRIGLIHAIGGVAAYWCIERTLSVFGLS